MCDSTVVIVGASSGFGFGLARELARSGCTVIAGARSACEIGAGVHYRQVDVTSDESVTDFFAFAQSLSPAPDGFVYSAGEATAIGYGWDVPVDEVQRVLDVAFMGFVRCVRHVVPGMRAAGRGSVLAIGSHSAREPVDLLGAYSSAKAAVEQFVRCLARELTGTGVRVNSLGIVAETALARGFFTRKQALLGKETSYPRLPEVRDNLPMAQFLLSPASGSVSGQILDAVPPSW